MKNGKKGKQVQFNPDGGDPDYANIIPTSMAPNSETHYSNP